MIRNTPFLVQLFVIYFSLPALGVRFDAEEAAVLGMSINFGGYATEILRAGIEAVPRGPDRGRPRARPDAPRRSSAFSSSSRAVKTVYPALASQFVILLLGSSIVSAISATELTAVTNSLQSQTFRAFEFYFVAAGMYLAMALAREGLPRGRLLGSSSCAGGRRRHDADLRLARVPLRARGAALDPRLVARRLRRRRRRRLRHRAGADQPLRAAALAGRRSISSSSRARRC